MKMANIDAVFDFMFTKPKKKDGVCLYSTSNVGSCTTHTCATHLGFSCHHRRLDIGNHIHMVYTFDKILLLTKLC